MIFFIFENLFFLLIEKTLKKIQKNPKSQIVWPFLFNKYFLQNLIINHEKVRKKNKKHVKCRKQIAFRKKKKKKTP